MRMNYERFLKNNLVRKVKPDFKQIAAQIKRAKRDLRTAESVISSDRTWAFAITYHAMMRVSKALMYSKGYLPTAKRSHKTIIEFTKIILGGEYDDLLRWFNRMRRRRHDFIYDAINNISERDAKSSIITAEKLIDEIVKEIVEANPQHDLFK